MWGRFELDSAVDGARAGSRTLNLGIKRLQTIRLRTSHGVSGRLTCIRSYDAIVSGRLRETAVDVTRIAARPGCGDRPNVGSRGPNAESDCATHPRLAAGLATGARRRRPNACTSSLCQRSNVAGGKSKRPPAHPYPSSPTTFRSAASSYA